MGKYSRELPPGPASTTCINPHDPHALPQAVMALGIPGDSVWAHTEEGSKLYAIEKAVRGAQVRLLGPGCLFGLSAAGRGCGGHRAAPSSAAAVGPRLFTALGEHARCTRAALTASTLERRRLPARRHGILPASASVRSHDAEAGTCLASPASVTRSSCALSMPQIVGAPMWLGRG